MIRGEKYWADIEREYGHLGDKVWCKECGRCFKSLGAHIKVHGLTSNEYKDKHRLLRSLPLCVDELSDRFRRVALKNHETGIYTNEQLQKFVSSKRMAGQEATELTREAVAKIWKGKKLPLHVVEGMRERALSRTEATKRKIARGVSRWQQENSKRKTVNCVNCGKKKRVTPSQAGKKFYLCNHKCLSEYAKKSDYAAHFTKAANE